MPAEKILSPKEQLIRNWEKNSTVVDQYFIKAFQNIPRELFIPDQSGLAYEDRPLPTLRGQSISQPSTVMIMTQTLNVRLGQTILEIGAGVGYQAAILSKLVGDKGKVISIEIIPELVQAAKKNLAALNIKNVIVIEGDGSRGVSEYAPYDRVIITAACPQIPPPLLEQIKEEGIIVAPLGQREQQYMARAIKRSDKLEFNFLGPFVFVPLQGKYGFPSKEENELNIR